MHEYSGVISVNHRGSVCN